MLEHLGVGDRGHPVTTVERQLLRQHASDRNRRCRIVAEHEPDLHMATAATQTAQRRLHRRLRAECIDRGVHPAAAGVTDRLDDVARGSPLGRDRHLGTELTRRHECARGHIDRDNACTERCRDHHCRQTHATAPVHREPIALARLRVLRHRVVRRRKPAAQRCGSDVRHRLGECHDVGVSRWHHDLAGP